MNTEARFCGSESAARIVKYLQPESECGFGLCAGDPACRDKHCPGHPCQTMTLPVVEGRFLDDYIQRKDSMTGDPLRLHDGIPVLRQRADELPIQYADEDQSTGQFLRGVVRSSKLIQNIAIAIGGGLLIGAVIYASTK